MARGRKGSKKDKRARGRVTQSSISPPYRERNGRKQRGGDGETITEAAAKKNRSVVVAHRMQHHDLTEHQAGQPEARWWLGSVYLSGRIPWRVHEAIDRYATIRRNMSKVCQTPRVRSGSVLDGFGGFDGDDGTDPHYVEWVARVKAQYRECRHVLLLCKDHMAAMMVDGAADGERLGDWLDAICEGGHALADMMKLPDDKPQKDEKAA